MRRTIAYCKWRATWWDKRIDMRVGLSLSLQEGLRAYAVRQALIQEGRAIHLQKEWSASEPQAQNLPDPSPDWVAVENADEDEDFEDE